MPDGAGDCFSIITFTTFASSVSAIRRAFESEPKENISAMNLAASNVPGATGIAKAGKGARGHFRVVQHPIQDLPFGPGLVVEAAQFEPSVGHQFVTLLHHIAELGGDECAD